MAEKEKEKPAEKENKGRLGALKKLIKKPKEEKIEKKKEEKKPEPKKKENEIQYLSIFFDYDE